MMNEDLSVGLIYLRASKFGRPRRSDGVVDDSAIFVDSRPNTTCVVHVTVFFGHVTIRPESYDEHFSA
jgi:hypothetical protein